VKFFRKNKSASVERAIQIRLKNWQDPQGDVALLFTRDRCEVFFGCWAAPAEPADHLVRLSFEHGWAARCVCSEYPPYTYEINERSPSSSILEVQESQWLKELSDRRLETYPRWKDWDHKRYLHYVVQGHDNYVDVVALGFTETLISREAAGQFSYLIDEA
jgi:hypothetical protein